MSCAEVHQDGGSTAQTLPPAPLRPGGAVVTVHLRSLKTVCWGGSALQVALGFVGPMALATGQVAVPAAFSDDLVWEHRVG